MLTAIGLALILIGWLEQLYRAVVRKNLTLSPVFLLLYVIGLGFLSYSGFRDSMTTIGILNGLMIIPAIILLIMIMVKNWKAG